MDLNLEKDSRYFEAMFEALYPTRKKFDLKEEIEKVVEELKTIFNKIEIRYTIRYGSELLFSIDKINGYEISRYISFDLKRLGLQHKEDLKNMIVPEIKYDLLRYWDDKILL